MAGGAVTVTWEQVHVGDKLRGNDNGVWTVAARTPGSRWVTAGHSDEFTMRNGEREVRVTARLIDPVLPVERADHSAQAQAWQALTDAGFRLTMLGESSMSADEFGGPADRDDGLIRNGRYRMPHPETGVEKSFTRVSNVARVLADDFGLKRWEMRMVAKGIAIRSDLAAVAAAADVDEDKDKLNDVVKQAKDAAAAKRGANNGTAFHKFAERHDKGESLASMAIPDAFAADVRGYAEALKVRGIKVLPQFMECTVFVPELEIVGTLDRIVSQPTGPTHSDGHAILDLKSGKDLSYAWLEIAVQQACYANASHIWDKVGKRWYPMPPVDKSRALIAHSPIGTGKTVIYGVDLIKGWKLAKASMHVREWRKDTYSWTVQPDGPKAVVMHLISQASSREALGKLWEIHRDQFAEADVMTAAKARLAALETVAQ